MPFTLQQNDIVAMGAAGGDPTVATKMIFSCVDTRNVSQGRDKSGKNISFRVVLENTR
jgi:hypothetical protein